MNKLGKYEIRRELGKGAMGIVYEAFDPVIERRVALKTILRENKDAAAMAEAMARFKREAQAAGRLNHPGVVAVYDYGEENVQLADGKTTQVAFIAMEYVDGRELRDLFEQNQRFTTQQVADVMLAILDALGHAHAHVRAERWPDQDRGIRHCAAGKFRTDTGWFHHGHASVYVTRADHWQPGGCAQRSVCLRRDSVSIADW